MSQNIPGHMESFVAGADLSGGKYKFCQVSADNTVTLATASTHPVLGVIWDIPYNAAGAQVGVMLSGTPMVMASDAISAGAKVTATTGGKAVTATAGQEYFGIAIQAATADGDLIQILLTRGQVPA